MEEVVEMDLIRSSGIKVKASYAESIRKQLIDAGLLRTDLKIKNKGGFVYLPVTDSKKVPAYFSFDKDFGIGYFKFKVLTTKISDYKEIVSIPGHLMKRLPTSFDVIGSIILIKLDEDLQLYQKRIGEALLKTHEHVTSIYRVDPVEGELRTRQVELICGKKQTRTIHKEFGVNIEIDIEKTYFNPRLANERRYIADQVKHGEIVLDMFTGVAPFPLMISRYANPNQIIAIDKNPDAIELATRNIKRNGIMNDIRLICDDAKNTPIITRQLNIFPNRMIMNLPFQAHDFIPQALKCIDKKAVIHLYMIGSYDTINNQLKQLEIYAKSHRFNIHINGKRIIKTYSPHEFYMGIDITAKKSKRDADVA